MSHDLDDIYRKLLQIRTDLQDAEIPRRLDGIRGSFDDRLSDMANSLRRIEHQTRTIDARVASALELLTNQLPAIAASLASIDAKTPKPVGKKLANKVELDANISGT